MTPLTNMSKLHFLYVEDDPFSREVLRMILTIIAGIPESHVTIFEDSVHFMDRLKALPVRPDVILLDIHMQPDDGFSLLKLLRAEENYRSARVVALTASVMNEEIRNSGTAALMVRSPNRWA